MNFFEFMKETNLHIENDIAEFQWDCFGKNVYAADLCYEDQEPEDSCIGITYSIGDGGSKIQSTVYMVEVLFDDCTIAYINPDYIEAYNEEANRRGVKLDGSSSVYEVGDFIHTIYTTNIEEIIDAINKRGESDLWFIGENADQEEDYEQAYVDFYDYDENHKAYEVVLNMDLTFNLVAADAQQALDKAKLIFAQAYDVSANNFKVKSETVVLNHGEV